MDALIGFIVFLIAFCAMPVAFFFIIPLWEDNQDKWFRGFILIAGGLALIGLNTLWQKYDVGRLLG